MRQFSDPLRNLNPYYCPGLWKMRKKPPCESSMTQPNIKADSYSIRIGNGPRMLLLSDVKLHSIICINFISIAQLFIQTPPPDPPKFCKMSTWPPKSWKKFKKFGVFFFLTSLPRVVFQEWFFNRNWSQKCKSRSNLSSLCILSKIFSFIMSYDSSMLYCIKLSLREPISIRYTQMYLIFYGKTTKYWKNLSILKEVSKNSAKIIVSYGSCIPV